MLEENHARARDFRLTLVFGFAALLIGLWSVPASLWEWDEVLFARGLHDYDIPTHSPHPPGFPLYIFLGRAALLLGVDDKTALCLVGLLFAFILGAASYRFFRELFEDRRTASAATAFLLAVPPVAIYSGAPRSDVPGLAAGLLVLALAMMGRASPRALAAAGLTLGLGFGVRVTILFAAAPVLIVVSLGWLVRRKWKPVVTAAGLALFGALLCYIPVVLTTGFDEYRRVMQAHTRYTSTIDTFLAPGLNSLWDYRLGRYFLDPWGAPLAAVFIGFCAMAGIVFLILRKRGWVLGWLALAFLPIMLFTVLYMTPLAAPLYVLPFMPLFTGLAAAGLVPPRLRSLPSSRPSPIAVGGFVAAAAAVVFSMVWTSPVLEMRRRQAGPSWQAVNRILESRDPAETVIRYDGDFLPFVSYAFTGYRAIPFQPLTPVDFNLLDPEAATVSFGTVLTTNSDTGRGGEHFRWKSRSGSSRLKKLSLGRYFDVFLKEIGPKRTVIHFDGWYDEERNEADTWRWMGRHSETALLTLFGKMRLRITAAVLPEALEPGGAAVITIKLDGREIDRFAASGGEFERTVSVETSAPGPWKRLTIETDRAVVPAERNPGGDPRELSLQVFALTWEPVSDSEPFLYSLESFVAGGWYLAEAAWRWTGAEAFLRLPPLWTDGRLEILMEVPEGADGQRARVALEINGREVDRFDPPAGEFIRAYDVPVSVHGGRDALLRLTADRLVAEEIRNLGIRVFHAAWAPAGIDR